MSGGCTTLPRSGGFQDPVSLLGFPPGMRRRDSDRECDLRWTLTNAFECSRPDKSVGGVTESGSLLSKGQIVGGP
jgi:hypothetical protein